MRFTDEGVITNRNASEPSIASGNVSRSAIPSVPHLLAQLGDRIRWPSDEFGAATRIKDERVIHLLHL
jgi:hypothetical protein